LSSCFGAASAGGAASTVAAAEIVSSATPQAMRKATRARAGNETRRLMNKRPPRSAQRIISSLVGTRRSDWPPVMSITWPVMKASSEASHSAAFAMSSTLTSRPSGISRRNAPSSVRQCEVALGHRRARKARRDRVDADTARAVLDGRDSHHLVDAALRGRVGRETRGRRQSGQRRGRDHRAAVGELRAHVLEEECGTDQVHFARLHQRLTRDLGQRRRHVHAGVIDRHVELAELVDGGAREALEIRLLRDVAGDGDTLDAGAIGSRASSRRAASTSVAPSFAKRRAVAAPMLRSSDAPRITTTLPSSLPMLIAPVFQ
jgi:hypothetical protein